jgi:hypothetical protein
MGNPGGKGRLSRACKRLPRRTSPTRLLSALRYVAPSIPSFVSIEVCAIDTLRRLRFLAAFWRWAFIAVVRMETVIHVALELARAMKPGAGTNEAIPVKPFRTVVASGSTGVRSGVIVTIRTVGSHSDVDGGLSHCFGSASREADSNNGS